MSAPAQHLDPELVAEIEALHLEARNIVQGALAGLHRSPRRGSSIEFSEHKVYTPGDEIRHIDWRAFAKTDRYHVKQFEDETNLTIDIFIDHSASMAFRSDDRPSKLAYAIKLAGALSYLALRQGDGAGLTAFANGATHTIPPRASSTHLLEILTRLAQLQPEGETHLAQTLDEFATGRRRRSMTILLSDLFDSDPAMTDALRRLAARRFDVVMLHILDPQEIDFNYDSPSIFESMEDPRRIFVHPRIMRNAYVREMQAWLKSTERALAEAGISYHRITTDETPSRALSRVIPAHARA